MSKPTPTSDRSACGYQDRGFYIPDRMAKALDAYVNHGEAPGSFLTAVLQNDLAEGCARADMENLRNLPAFMAWLYNYAPSPCWGSKEKMEAWLGRFQPAQGVEG